MLCGSWASSYSSSSSSSSSQGALPDPPQQDVVYKGLFSHALKRLKVSRMREVEHVGKCMLHIVAHGRLLVHHGTWCLCCQGLFRCQGVWRQDV
jgi:hypothetical protein